MTGDLFANEDALAQELVWLLALARQTLELREATEALKRVGPARRRLTQARVIEVAGSLPEVQAVAKRLSLRSAGLVERRALVSSGQLEPFARALQQVAPRSRYAYSFDGERFERDLAIALYREDWAEARELRRRVDRNLYRTHSLTLLLGPLPEGWLQRVPVDLAAHVARDQLALPAAAREPDVPLAWMAEQLRPEDPEEGLPGSLVIAALLADAPRPGPPDDAGEGRHAAACLAFVDGDGKAAIKLWRRALRELKEENWGRKVPLPGPLALLWPLALLLDGTATARKSVGAQVRAWAEESRTRRPIEWLFGHGLMVASGEPVPPAPVQRWEAVSGPPGDWLCVLLLALATGGAPGPRVIEHAQRLAGIADETGEPWIGRQLRAVIGALTGGDVPEGTLAARIQPGEDWERRLDALLAVKPPPRPRGKGPARRAQWRLRGEGAFVDLELHAQKRTRSGWGKPAAVPLGRLRNTAKLPWLSEQDLAVAACLSEEQYGYRSRSKVYSFRFPQALVALVGHPNVVDGRGEPIQLRLAPPRLVLRERDDGVELELKGGPVEGDWELRPLGPGEVALVTLDARQKELAAILRQPLVVPKAGRKRVLARLDVLSQVAPLETDAAAAQAGDPAPVLQLRRVGDGLSVRARVRPLGPEGPAMTPGRDAVEVFGTVGGQPARARRSLDRERTALAALGARSPWLAPLASDPTSPVVVDDPLDSLELLTELSDLQAEGRLEWPQGQPLSVRPVASAAMDVAGGGDWFTATGSVVVDEGEVLRLQELLAAPTRGRFVQLADGRFLALTEALAAGLERLRGAAEVTKSRVRFHPMALPLLSGLLEEAPGKRSRALTALRRRMEQAESSVAVPRTLQAELRDYQVEGFAWMARLAAWGAGACLADDMGLGKTVQALALLLHRVEDGPSLVVAPTSVAFNWEVEAARFAPTLRVHRFGAGDREAQLAALGAGDLLVCTYGLLAREADALAGVSWGTVVLDEAQAIKNPTTQRAKAACALPAKFRVATTGTPIENRVEELWSLFRFLVPGLLGSRKGFTARFGAAGPALRRQIRPFVLRRLKSQVLEALPPRTEILLRVAPTRAEAATYEALRRTAEQELAAGSDTPQARLAALAWITKLRLACCDPRLVQEDAAPGAKRAELLALLSELADGNHRALVFSQFVKHLSLVRQALEEAGIPYQYLDGSTPASGRKQAVEAFQRGEGDAFLISLKAGGTGLNLTAADYVVHLDPWWNPAVEDQASDRAHRIGQTRPVTVYKMVLEGTIEDRIQRLQASKRELATELLSGTESAAAIGYEDLVALLSDGEAP